MHIFFLVVHFFRRLHESNQQGKSCDVPESLMPCIIAYVANNTKLRARNIGKIVNLPYTAKLSKKKYLTLQCRKSSIKWSKTNFKERRMW